MKYRTPRQMLWQSFKLIFKPKQVDIVSLTSKTITAMELQAIKDKNRTKVSMIGRRVLFTEETLTVAKLCIVAHSRLLPI